MSKLAFGAFEKQSSGSWLCVTSTSIPIHRGSVTVPVQAGTRFNPRTVFAGYDDFTAHLENVAEEVPSIQPRLRE